MNMHYAVGCVCGYTIDFCTHHIVAVFMCVYIYTFIVSKHVRIIYNIMYTYVYVILNV